MLRRTLCAPFSLSGPGVHTGRAARVVARPAPWGSGLAFRRGASWIPVHLDHARPQPGSTVLVADGATVGTPEHLLAALVGAGITDAILEIDGPEVPILDGSALPWWEAIHGSGIAEGPEIAPRVVARPVHVALGAGRAWLAPFDGSELEITVGWDDPRLPRGTLVTTPCAFDAIAGARTFVLASEIAAARAAGLGRGASAANTVVLDPEAPPVLRVPDEILRHKALDAVGDLALVGAPFRGRLAVERGSHRLHAAILHRWREDDPAAWAA